jgi:hypothetical protein
VACYPFIPLLFDPRLRGGGGDDTSTKNPNLRLGGAVEPKSVQDWNEDDVAFFLRGLRDVVGSHNITESYVEIFR